MPHVETADWHIQQIKNLQHQIDKLEEELDNRGQTVRSMEVVKSELSDLQNTMYIAF